MPTSTYSHINTVCAYLQEARPKSFLDVGLGNGKIGFIARDLLDVMLGERYHRKDWKVKIDGIEIFPDYIQEHQKAIYNDIYIGNALEVIDGLGKYDMVYIGDVLEHFEKEDGWMMLDKMADHSSAYMIVSVPLGENWTQPPIYGNPHEEHKSFWKLEELEHYSIAKELLNFPKIGQYGTFLIRRNEFIHARAREVAEAMYADGQGEAAIEFLVNRIEDLPPDIMSEYVVVDFLLNLKKLKEAHKRLTEAAKLFPGEEVIKQHLAQLEKVLNSA